MACNAAISSNNHLLSFTSVAIKIRDYKNLFCIAEVPIDGATWAPRSVAGAIAIISVTRSTAYTNTATVQRIGSISAMLAVASAAAAAAATDKKSSYDKYREDKTIQEQIKFSHGRPPQKIFPEI